MVLVMARVRQDGKFERERERERASEGGREKAEREARERHQVTGLTLYEPSCAARERGERETTGYESYFL